MEASTKKKKKSNIFSEIDMDLIAEKIDQNLDVLEKFTDYNIVEYKINELELQLPNYFDEGQKKILKKYLTLKTESIKYQNTLAYYLGMKAREEIDKLK